MWYLIIPPVIVVVSLAFVLWYLSRKGADPSVAEKMARMDTLPKSPSFSRTREFFLRLLEKIVQRFKVNSLRMHNALHGWTQSLKEKRRKVQETVSEENKRKEKEREISREEKPERSFRFLRKRKMKEEESIVSEEMSQAAEAPQEDTFADPIVRRRRFLSRGGTVEQPMESERSEERRTEVRPIVSAKLTRPESSTSRPKRAILREEDLIKRIANNPKDFTAYEALGDYYMETSNIEDAKECYRQVLKLSPVQRMVKIKIRRLEKLLNQKS